MSASKKASDSRCCWATSSGFGRETVVAQPCGAFGELDGVLPFGHGEGDEKGGVIHFERDHLVRSGLLERQVEGQRRGAVLEGHDRLARLREGLLGPVRLEMREIAEIGEGFGVDLGEILQLVRRQLAVVVLVEPLRDEGRIGRIEGPAMAHPQDLAVGSVDDLGFGRHPHMRVREGRRRKRRGGRKAQRQDSCCHRSLPRTAPPGRLHPHRLHLARNGSQQMRRKRGAGPNGGRLIASSLP